MLRCQTLFLTCGKIFQKNPPARETSISMSIEFQRSVSLEFYCRRRSVEYPFDDLVQCNPHQRTQMQWFTVFLFPLEDPMWVCHWLRYVTGVRHLKREAPISIANADTRYLNFVLLSGVAACEDIGSTSTIVSIVQVPILATRYPTFYCFRGFEWFKMKITCSIPTTSPWS